MSVLYTVPAAQDGWRLDRILAGLDGVGSRSRARQAVETGKVLVAGQVVDATACARPIAGETRIEVDWNRRGPSPREAQGRRLVEARGIGVLHLDEHLVAVDKPAGLLSDTATYAQKRHEESLRVILGDWLGAVRMVHRIDRDTSGVVLVARTVAAEVALREQFERREPERLYRAFVHGLPSPPQGEWVDWMHWDPRLRRQVAGPGHNAVEARCTYVVKAVWGDVAELDLRLDTGRRNQVRLQALLHDHPLVGERQYVPDDWQPRVTCGRQALHAARLVVRHPATGEPLALDAPLPEDLAKLRQWLRRGEGRERRPTRS